MAGAAKFNDALKSYFRSSDGAYSKATEMEGDKKRQYNVKSMQRNILEKVLEKELEQRLGEGGAKELARKGITPYSTMKMYPSGKEIRVTLVYPKKDRRELRIYFAKDTFQANAHDYILIYVRDGQPWIGALSSIAFDLISASRTNQLIENPRDNLLEEELDQYQSLINDTPEVIQKNVSALAWKRRASVARDALVESKYKCELFPDMQTFTSRLTGLPFMEAHHLIPMKAQSYFTQNLDVIGNICVLNPTAHRLIHHAKFTELEPCLATLYENKAAFLEKMNIGWNDLKEIYQ